MFSSALLVSDPKATSRCLQSPGRAALSVRRAAEIPVCQFKWHSPSSSACIFRSTAKCGKQGTQLSPLERAYLRSQQAKQHPQKTATQGGSFLLLSSFNMLPFFYLLPAGLPVQPGSLCCMRTASLEKKVSINLLHLPTVDVHLSSNSALGALHVHLVQDLHSSGV